MIAYNQQKLSEKSDKFVKYVEALLTHLRSTIAPAGDGYCGHPQ